MARRVRVGRRRLACGDGIAARAAVGLSILDELLRGVEHLVEIRLRQPDLRQIGDEIGQQADVAQAIDVEIEALAAAHLLAERAETRLTDVGEVERIGQTVPGAVLGCPLVDHGAAPVGAGAGRYGRQRR